MMAGRAHSTGFTLAEMLIALAIFAAMGTLAYLTLSQAIRLRDRVNAERDHWRGLAVAFSRLEDDLSQARARAGRDYNGIFTPALPGNPGAANRDEETFLEFTRGGMDRPEDALRSDLQRVAYGVKGNALMRFSWGTPDPLPGSKPAASRMLGDVKQIRVQYMGADRTWLDQWPPRGAAATALPFGIKLSLDIVNREEYTRVFVLHD